MQYRLLHTLGLDDARKCNESFGGDLELSADKLKAGEVVELSKTAAEYFTDRLGYKGLLEPAKEVKGVAKAPELKGA